MSVAVAGTLCLSGGADSVTVYNIIMLILISDAPVRFKIKKYPTEIEQTEPTFLNNQTIFGFAKKIIYF